jgi:dynein heavy chain, axonemal
LAPILKQEHFTFEIMKGKSQAAAFLCKWIINVVIYNSIYKRVKPLMDMAEDAEKMAKEKEGELMIVKEKVRLINERVDGLKAKLYEAEEAKRRVEHEA